MHSLCMEPMLFSAIFILNYINLKISIEYHNTYNVLFIVQTNTCTCASVGLNNKLYKMHSKKGNAVPLQAWTGPEGS